MKTTGLKPRDFAWVIGKRLATSARLGGQGFEHRRVRRQEEIAWLLQSEFTAVVSLLPGAQNVNSYEEAGLDVYRAPVDLESDPEVVEKAFDTIHDALSGPDARVLVHRNYVDDTVAGVLAGYVVYSGLVDDERLATMAIQAVIGRPLGPGARALIPSAD
ncbi:MAG: hypothetical protein OXF41_05705 [bacterium]|nr:hypothetical protein [bacterium]